MNLIPHAVVTILNRHPQPAISTGPNGIPDILRENKKKDSGYQKKKRNLLYQKTFKH